MVCRYCSMFFNLKQLTIVYTNTNKATGCTEENKKQKKTSTSKIEKNISVHKAHLTKLINIHWNADILHDQKCKVNREQNKLEQKERRLTKRKGK